MKEVARIEVYDERKRESTKYLQELTEKKKSWMML